MSHRPLKQLQEPEYLVCLIDRKPWGEYIAYQGVKMSDSRVKVELAQLLLWSDSAHSYENGVVFTAEIQSADGSYRTYEKYFEFEPVEVII
jgi:hypothetical protein